MAMARLRGLNIQVDTWLGCITTHPLFAPLSRGLVMETDTSGAQHPWGANRPRAPGDGCGIGPGHGLQRGASGGRPHPPGLWERVLHPAAASGGVVGGCDV